MREFVNQLKLNARIIEKSAVRFTPAGIPIATATLAHHSMQFEANANRTTELEIQAVAAGEIADRFNQLPFETELAFSGFLARKNRNSKSLVFHITDFGTNL